MAAVPRAYRKPIRREGRRIDRWARRKYGISGAALLAKLGKGESGFRRGAVSYAGARGAYQFMPGTRREVLRQTGADAYGSPAEATRAARIYLRRGGLRENYNPGGGQEYVDYILGQKVGPIGRDSDRVLATAAKRSRNPRDRAFAERNAPEAPDTTAQRRALAASYFSRRGRPGALLDLATGLSALDQAAPTPGSGQGQSAPQRRRGRRRGTIPGLSGDETKRVIGFSKLAHSKELTTTSGKRGRVNTASGGISDHAIVNTTANARDWSGSADEMRATARAIARRLGVRYKPGVTNVVRGGYRYQLIHETNVGGNHYNHVHLGVKRVGKRRR